jgi:hypothetical protein
MNIKLKILLALAAAAVATSATATTLDYTNPAYKCDTKIIQTEIQTLWSSGGRSMQDNAKVLFVKNVQELKRDRDNLWCSATITANLGAYEGTWLVRFYNEDGETWSATAKATPNFNPASL